MRPLIFALILCGCVRLSVAKEKPEDLARPLLKLAADRALFLPDAKSPFKVLVHFRVHGGGSHDFKGSYIWLVTPAGDFRKEVKMPDYEDVQVLKGSTLWSKRNLDFMPLQAALAEYSLTNFRLLTSDVSIERYSRSSEHHTELRCVDVKQGKYSRTLCVDANGDLRKVELKELRFTYEYSDYRPVESKFAPYKITARRYGGTTLEAEVVSLAPATTADERAIEPLPGAQKREGCLNPTLPFLAKTFPPPDPKDFQGPVQPQGEVILYLIVASDGTVTRTSVVQTLGKEMDDAVVAMVKQWKYQPSKCQSAPIDSEVFVSEQLKLVP